LQIEKYFRDIWLVLVMKPTVLPCQKKRGGFCTIDRNIHSEGLEAMSACFPLFNQVLLWWGKLNCQLAFCTDDRLHIHRTCFTWQDLVFCFTRECNPLKNPWKLRTLRKYNRHTERHAEQ
jgi:hypothetical protein